MNAVPAPDPGPDAGAVWHYGDPLGEQRAAETDAALIDRSAGAGLDLDSIFDYAPKDDKRYDIVHCRGVLSHTAAKEAAFSKIATFVKPGGFLIFGDPNKAGGFQNMLQRYAVYRFASTPDEMVEVSRG